MMDLFPKILRRRVKIQKEKVLISPIRPRVLSCLPKKQ
jgi:hypothetical protein